MISIRSLKSIVCEVVGSALFLVVLSAATCVPWLLHFSVGWWAGILAIPVLFSIYDALFVPRGSICMGIPFVIPMGSAVALLLCDCALLFRWVVT